MGFALYQRIAWLALCGLIFAALSPSISKLLATSQGIEWTEICSTEGTRLVALDTNSKQIPDAPMAADSYCGYCVLLHYSPFVPTPAASPVMAVLPEDGPPPSCGGRPLFKRFVRDAHRTRAPPDLA